MSEYWVSHKKYYCTYCKIYISDDAPSKQQHESGLRHKGNRERYIRGLYKSREKHKQDLEEEKREIARIDQAAQAAFTQDVASGNAKSAGPSRATSSVSISTGKAVAAQKADSPWANYSTAASLGYTDPDVERMNVEAERRRTQGVAGEWEAVTAPTSANQEQTKARRESSKREDDGQEDDEEDGRRFKLRKKTFGAGLGEIRDLPIKLKPKKIEEVVADEPDKVEENSEQNLPPPPKWTSRGWKRPSEESVEPAASDTEIALQAVAEPVSQDESIKADVKEEPLLELKEPVVKSEESDGGSFFRKRKLGGANRGRRQ